MLILCMPAEIRWVTEKTFRGNAPCTQQFAELVFFDGVVHHIPATGKYLIAVAAFVDGLACNKQDIQGFLIWCCL
ncbi:hypothetical protein DPMN_115918 [Dreissena polymorpha]|uniref:Uncharacterized protein n=1 Tax=Dreissena polymorpha TaxID=45954 RepID=A0A9D4KM34_DREPO|nr:hypothetical protein DPMN_115918 [Dreissena polymorpha]